MILSGCDQKSNNKQNISKISDSKNSDTVETEVSKSPVSTTQEDGTNYNAEEIEGKARIDNVKINDGQINLQIKNLTSDNLLITAYLEYVRVEDGKEMGVYSLDAEMLNIPSNGVSDNIVFYPQKPLGKVGFIRIKELIFKNEKDNYKIK